MKKVDGVYTLVGSKPGKTLTIIGGVHGDEICGIKALEEIISSISIDSGRVHFVYGNLRAIKLNKRQVEMNLNRAFRLEGMLLKKERQSYERQRALEIMSFLDESDALLDVHSSNTPASVPFIICEPHSFEVASHLPFNIRSYGWDVVHPGGTDYYMNRKGKIAICVECGHHLDPRAPQLAKDSIMIFLHIMGVINGSVPSREIINQRIIYAREIYFSKVNFTPFREFAEFELLSEGELIGVDGNSYILSPKNSCIIFPRKRDNPGEEAFVLGEEVSSQ